MSKTVLFRAIQFSLSKQSKTVLFLTTQFSMSTQFLFSSIWPIDRTLISYYHSRPEWSWKWCQWRGTSHSPKLQHYLNLTIRLFSIISRTLIKRVLPLCRKAVGVFYSPIQLGKQSFGTCPVKNTSFELETSNQYFF